MGSSTCRRATCFSPSMDAKVHFVQKHPHRHTQNNVWPNVWRPHGPSSQHIKVTITESNNVFQLREVKTDKADPFCKWSGEGLLRRGFWLAAVSYFLSWWWLHRYLMLWTFAELYTWDLYPFLNVCYTPIPWILKIRRWGRGGTWSIGNICWNVLGDSESRSVVSDCLWPHGLYSPWNSPGQNTGVGSLSLLQGIFPTQGSNSGLLHCRHILYQLSHRESPKILEWEAYSFSNESSQPRNQTRVSWIAGGFFTKISGKPNTIREVLSLGDNMFSWLVSFSLSDSWMGNRILQSLLWFP